MATVFIVTRITSTDTVWNLGFLWTIYETTHCKSCKHLLFPHALTTSSTPSHYKKTSVFVLYWYQFVRNDDVCRLTKQPKLTAIIQSRRLTLFGHIMCMDDNADAKRILLASPPADWRKQLGRPRITWLSTVQQDLKQHSKAADLAQNRPLWRMVSTMALRNRELHARNDDDDTTLGALSFWKWWHRTNGQMHWLTSDWFTSHLRRDD